MLGNIDVVHGVYYVLTKLVTDAFGISEFTLRILSLLAAAATVFVTVLTGRRLAGTSAGVLGGIVLVFLPRFEFAATDGRSYSLNMLASVLMVYCAVRLRASGSWKAAGGVAAASLFATGLSFYSVMMPLVLLTMLFVDEALRDQWKKLTIALVPALLAALGLALAASNQKFQVSWIPGIDGYTFLDVFFLQWFGDGVVWPRVPLTTPVIWQEAVATPALCLLGVAATVLACVLGDRRLTRFYLFWIFIPTFLAVAASLVMGASYYLPRYLSFTVPGVALLMGYGILVTARAAGPRRRVASLLLAAVTAFGTLYVTSQRTEFERASSDDFRFVSDVMGHHAKAGESFVASMGDDLFLAAYPAAFEGLHDLTLDETAAHRGLIFNQRIGIVHRVKLLQQQRVVWSIHKTAKPEQDTFLKAHGFVEAQSWRGPVHSVVKFIRR